jgi:hypothetical protein
MALLALLAALAGPWNPHCPSMPAETTVPPAIRSAGRAFYPWAGRVADEAIHRGPVWLLALSARSEISRDGDARDAANRYLHRALVAVSPAYRGAVTISGLRIGKAGARTRLLFTPGASRCTVSNPTVTCGTPPPTERTALTIAPATGWRTMRTEISIGRTGCFTIRASGEGLDVSLPLAVPGPDWGTPGW